jgi:hypothetical protein
MPTSKPNMTHRPLLISFVRVHPRPLVEGSQAQQSK